MKKHIIWSNIDLNIDEWRDGYTEFCEINNIEPGDDNDVYYYMEELNAEYLNDERMNLNKIVNGDILIIADIGRWNGRANGYKIITSGNIRDILYCDCDYIEWYSDGHNIRATAHHHDGTDRYLYRIIRPERNIDNLLDAIYNGEQITNSKLNYYTKSLHKDVAAVYGW